jgi:predicted O-methyltransferase YrrM
MSPRRILEFGTAEGRTTINLALQAPEKTEVITVNAPPLGSVGVLYHGHPLESKITEVLVDLTRHDWTSYYNSIDFIFCDALDSLKGVAIETSIAFSMVRLGGIVLWHDYGSGEGRTQYLNGLSVDLPLRNIQDTCLVCLRVDTPELLGQLRRRSTLRSEN